MRTHTTWLARMALVPLALTLTLTLTPRPARAFCGFYVGGAGAKLFNKPRWWCSCATVNAPC